MSRLSEITVRIETPVRSGGLGGGAAAVLSEIVVLLEKAAGGGEPTPIDLRSLPMSAQDRIELQARLGHGEVSATLNSEGISSVQETAVSGVWWISHRDRQGELIAELIEVAAIPQILKASTDEMAASAHALRQQLSMNQPAGNRDNHASVG